MEFLFPLSGGSIVEINTSNIYSNFILNEEGLLYKDVLILKSYPYNPLDQNLLLKPKDNKFVIHPVTDDYDISFFPLYSREELLNHYSKCKGYNEIYDIIADGNLNSLQNTLCNRSESNYN